jgi:hypothetical protein
MQTKTCICSAPTQRGVGFDWAMLKCAKMSEPAESSQRLGPLT